jgi:hypothetical protein
MLFEPPPLERQHKVGELFELVNKEQQLLPLLAAKKKQLIDATLFRLSTE